MTTPVRATDVGTMVPPVTGGHDGMARRRRRPTGAKPPLPRHLGTSGKAWLLAVFAGLLLVVLAAFDPVQRFGERADAAVLRVLAESRTEWLNDVMVAVDRFFSGWPTTVVSASMVIALVVLRRWQRLLTWIGALALLEMGGSILWQNISRPRPYDVTTIGRWSGWSMPSPPVAVVTAVLIGITYTLVVAGRPRTVAKWTTAVLLVLFAGARLYLGVDHPTDVLLAVAFGVALPLAGFRYFTPNEVLPVAYRRGKTAHLDVEGRRADAIRQAVGDQLGLMVDDIKPVGLAGSGGSTPLRLRVGREPDRYLFAKLYAMNHVRADRWYKLGRVLLYGRLEDETPFQSVKRLVEFEDYAARLFDDVGIPTASSHGIVELTPEREYMLVTEFLEGAVELGVADVEVDDAVIEQGLVLVRRLWDAGLAHRDIKPANLLVRDGRLYLIDVAFAQVRPSPWRQAIDLANMMLVLAVRTDPERVYRRALEHFTPDDVAEAFAATRGVASPSQLRTVMKQDGRDLVARFRALAPERAPIPLQRWGIRRVALAVGIFVLLLLAVVQVGDMLAPAHDLPVTSSPDCGTNDLMVLVAQSQPAATKVPCIATLPSGWELEDIHVQRNRTTFDIGSDRAGDSAIEVTLHREGACDVAGAEAVPSDEAGTRRFERPERLAGGLQGTRSYLFPGGCVTYEYTFADDAPASIVFEADEALGFVAREDLVAHVRSTADLRLCGAGVPCPGGTRP
ncbi:MAG TPA: phosphatase PAP2 family protein [Acidimicrobiales bacterium]|nr:phosphatase PAP2 family protein [Acidimicrobiales bacterium]